MEFTPRPGGGGPRLASPGQARGRGVAQYFWNLRLAKHRVVVQAALCVDRCLRRWCIGPLKRLEIRPVPPTPYYRVSFMASLSHEFQPTLHRKAKACHARWPIRMMT